MVVQPRNSTTSNIHIKHDAHAILYNCNWFDANHEPDYVGLNCVIWRSNPQGQNIVDPHRKRQNVYLKRKKEKRNEKSLRTMRSKSGNDTHLVSNTT